MQISSTAKLEFGFRIQSTQASYRELEALLGKDQKVDWARTSTHPNRTRFFKVDASIDDNGHIVVPEAVINAFCEYGGFLMVKLVTPQPIGNYGNLAMYHKLWGLDKVSPRRDNGDYVYSMPIHGLDKVGEGRRFFFALMIDGNDTDVAASITLTVQKFTVTRGKGHFTVVREKVGQLTASAENMAASSMHYRSEKDEAFKPLKDLPVAEAVAEFLKVARGGSLV